MSCGSTTGLLCRELGARGSARQTSKMDKRVELGRPFFSQTGRLLTPNLGRQTGRRTDTHTCWPVTSSHVSAPPRGRACMSAAVLCGPVLNSHTLSRPVALGRQPSHSRGRLRAGGIQRHPHRPLPRCLREVATYDHAHLPAVGCLLRQPPPCQRCRLRLRSPLLHAR